MRLSTGSKLESEAAPRFETCERVAEFAEQACENDYIVQGRVGLARLHKPGDRSDADLFYVDAGKIRVEVLASRDAFAGQLNIGALRSPPIYGFKVTCLRRRT